jgi:hypothetical protein
VSLAQADLLACGAIDGVIHILDICSESHERSLPNTSDRDTRVALEVEALQLAIAAMLGNGTAQTELAQRLYHNFKILQNTARTSIHRYWLRFIQVMCGQWPRVVCTMLGVCMVELCDSARG